MNSFRMQVDYYKTLGVKINASQQDIKKAYRLLALKYHPDKNLESQFSNHHFQEIQLAYSILSDSTKRKQYDEERYFAGLTAQKSPITISPQWILDECKKLNVHLKKIDSYSMNHLALRDYILMLLSDSHIAILQTEKKLEINRQVIQEILVASDKIALNFYEEILSRLIIIADKQPEDIELISKTAAKRKQQKANEQYLPIIIILITIILCILMYWYSK